MHMRSLSLCAWACVPEGERVVLEGAWLAAHRFHVWAEHMFTSCTALYFTSQDPVTVVGYPIGGGWGNDS